MTHAIRNSFAATVTMIAMYVTIVCVGTPTRAFAVHDAQFELEGNIADDSDPKADWASIFDSTGNASPTLPPHFLSSQFTRDYVTGSHADATTFSSGSKDTDNISGWECTQSNNSLDKADLLNTYATFHVDPATNETMLYFGAERFTNSGAGNVGVWFLQDPTVGCTAPASGSAPFTGDHVDGDLLLVAAFTQGGQVSAIDVYRWEGGANGHLSATPILSGVDCKTDPTNHSVCATSNTGSVTPPWPTEDKDGDNVLDVSEFLEGGFNLTQLGLSLGCFNKVLVNTRNAPSPSATLSDYALGAFVTCNDSNACTVDSCDPELGCVATAISCDDSNPCTDDSCDPAVGCVHTNNSLPCDDGSVCTTDDVCSGGSCVGSASSCDDGNPCTDDGCDPAGGCNYTNHIGSCDDGNACTSDDTCNAGICGGAALNCDDGNVCTDESCDPDVGCVYANNDASCDDGDACTQYDSCTAGACLGSDPVVCTPLDACHQIGTCDPQSGQCSNPAQPNGTPCSDDNACTGGSEDTSDTCDGAGTCVPGASVVCEALDACHEAGTCDPQSGECSNPVKPNGTPCDDGNACTRGDEGEGDRCNESGTCVPGTPVVCEALDDCHEAGTCDPASGICSHPAKTAGASCSDDNPCTLGDTCDGAGDCNAGAPRDCTPDDPCRESGTCDVATGSCVVTPRAVDCGEAVCSDDPDCVEVCDNCIDDNSDGLVDREDPQCIPFADGAGFGTSDPRTTGKNIVKCQKIIQSAGARLANVTRAGLERCAAKVFQCIQQKPGDARCLAKARAGCAKQAAALADGPRSLAQKLTTKIRKSCGPKKPGLPPRVSRDNLCDPTGLGFVGEIDACDDPNSSAEDVLDAVLDHLVHEHRCRVAQLFTTGTPRGMQLLALADLHIDGGECTDPNADGGNLGLENPKTLGKAAVKCQKAIGASSARFYKTVASSYQRCAAAVFQCIEKKPNDLRCRTKAEAKCQKRTAKLFQGDRSAEARLRKKVAKACGPRRSGVSLAVSDIRDLVGLGYSAFDSRCNALGVSSLGSLDDINECVVREYVCRAEQVLTSQMPRTHELLDLGGAVRR